MEVEAAVKIRVVEEGLGEKHLSKDVKATRKQGTWQSGNFFPLSIFHLLDE